MNMERYEYLIDDDGNFSNPFDLGAFSNIFEFFKFPGFAVDYRSVFEVTNSADASQLRTEEPLVLKHIAGGSANMPHSEERSPVDHNVSVDHNDIAVDSVV